MGVQADRRMTGAAIGAGVGGLASGLAAYLASSGSRHRLRNVVLGALGGAAVGAGAGYGLGARASDGRGSSTGPAQGTAQPPAQPSVQPDPPDRQSDDSMYAELCRRLDIPVYEGQSPREAYLSEDPSRDTVIRGLLDEAGVQSDGSKSPRETYALYFSGDPSVKIVHKPQQARTYGENIAAVNPYLRSAVYDYLGDRRTPAAIRHAIPSLQKFYDEHKKETHDIAKNVALPLINRYGKLNITPSQVDELLEAYRKDPNRAIDHTLQVASSKQFNDITPSQMVDITLAAARGAASHRDYLHKYLDGPGKSILTDHNTYALAGQYLTPNDIRDVFINLYGEKEGGAKYRELAQQYTGTPAPEFAQLRGAYPELAKSLHGSIDKLKYLNLLPRWLGGDSIIKGVSGLSSLLGGDSLENAAAGIKDKFNVLRQHLPLRDRLGRTGSVGVTLSPREWRGPDGKWRDTYSMSYAKDNAETFGVMPYGPEWLGGHDSAVPTKFFGPSALPHIFESLRDNDITGKDADRIDKRVLLDGLSKAIDLYESDPSYTSTFTDRRGDSRLYDLLHDAIIKAVRR